MTNSERGFLPPAGTGLEKRRNHRATIALITLVAAVLGAAEFSARFFFPRISHIQQRIAQDQREVMAIGAHSPDAPPTVLFIGNSLLLAGLDYPKLRADLAPDARVVRYVVENTAYLDWYYGLRRLFAEGVQPSRVVLCLSLDQTLDRGIQGEYSARYLFLARDLPAVARDAGLDHTRASGLIFSHWSAFYADRATIRNYILNVADPGYSATLHALALVPPALLPEPEALAESRARLRAINHLCREKGSDFMLLVPPALSRRGEILLRAGALEKVDVDMPVPVSTLGHEFFGDNVHLNQEGRKLFTEALARDIRARLRLRR